MGFEKPQQNEALSFRKGPCRRTSWLRLHEVLRDSLLKMRFRKKRELKKEQQNYTMGNVKV